MAVTRKPLFVVVFAAWLGGSAAPAADDALIASDETLLKAVGLATDGPALLEFFRKNTLTAQQRDGLEELVKQLGDPSFRVREKATTELTRLGRVALPALRRAAADPDSERSLRAERCLKAVQGTWGTEVPVAAARVLAHRPPPGALRTLLDYFPTADDLLLDDGFLAVVAALGLRDGQAEPLLVKAVGDRHRAVRQAAAWVVGRSADGKQRALVRPLLTDADVGVRLRAAQGLLAGKEKDASATLVALLADTPVEVARHAEDLLCRLAGEHAPPVSFGNDDVSRRQARDGWTRWWRERGAALDLNKFDVGAAALGYTMICAAGRVYETGRDGKVRWEIAGLQFPVEAQILPGNRVLIGEQGTQRITEREFGGKILWECRVTEGLVGCQRLPTGNTLVVTHRRIYEVDGTTKEVKTHVTPGETLWSGQRLANGNFLYLGSRQLLTEADAGGKVVHSWKVDISGIGLVRAEALPGGVLIGERGRLVQYDLKGQVVWESTAASAATSAARLPNGNVVASCYISNRVVEVDRTGKALWEQAVTSPIRIRRR